MSNNLYLRPFALIFNLLLFVSVSAGSIHGWAKEDAGKTVHLLVQPNVFSSNYELIESFLIAENGEFHVSVPSTNARLYSLLIGDRVAELVVEENRDYHVIFPGSKELRFKRSNFNKVSLLFRSFEIGDSNLLIEEFNRAYDQLYKDLSFDLASSQSSGSQVYLRSRKGELDATGLIGNQGEDSLYVSRSFLEEKVTQFKDEVDSLMGTCTNDFAIQYLRYATLQTSMHLFQAHPTEIEEVISSMSDVHPEGIALLNTFYSPRMNKSQMGENYLTFLKSINKHHSPDSLMRSIQTMPFVSEQNRDLVQLVVLSKALDHPEVDRKSALRTLFELSESEASLAGEAKAILDDFLLGKKGQPLAEFRLFTLAQEVITHADFEDDWLFIGFFDSRSPSSQVELKMMDELHRKYGRQVSFLAIFIDEDVSSVKQFLSGKGFDFDLVFAGGNPTLLQGFKVKSTPEFVLYTPEGSLNSSYTKKPSEGIEDDFKRLLRDKQRAPIKVWDD